MQSVRLIFNHCSKLEIDFKINTHIIVIYCDLNNLRIQWKIKSQQLVNRHHNGIIRASSVENLGKKSPHRNGCRIGVNILQLCKIVITYWLNAA